MQDGVKWRDPRGGAQSAFSCPVSICCFPRMLSCVVSCSVQGWLAFSCPVSRGSRRVFSGEVSSRLGGVLVDFVP
jgi:hypothetical protein